MGWIALVVVLAVVATASGESAPALVFQAKTKPLTPEQARAVIASDTELPIVRTYRGFPQTMRIPKGFEPIEVWGEVEGGWGPNPMRFEQWHGLMSKASNDAGGGLAGHRSDAQRERWSELSERFARLYYFATADDGEGLRFWVIGRPTTSLKCCAQTLCTLKEEYRTGGTWIEEEHMARVPGGKPADWRGVFGPGWSCVCQQMAGECYELLVPEVAEWPLVTEENPQSVRG